MKIEVTASPADDGFVCTVVVDDGRSTSRHTVHVRPRDLARWAPGRSPDELVRRSFEFLLDRESKESILREFELSVIPRYFPEYAKVISAGRANPSD